MVKDVEISPPNSLGFLYPDQAGNASGSNDSEVSFKSIATFIKNSGVPISLVLQALDERFDEIFEL